MTVHETKQKPLALVMEDAPGYLLQYLTAQDGPGQPVAVETRREQLETRIEQAAALIVRNRTVVDGALLDRARRLRVIGRLGAGTDNIDIATAYQRGITVVYSPWGNSRSVAEFALTLMLALAKRVLPFAAAARQGNWHRSAVGLELHGRTLGILGYGAVGRHLARMALGLNMNVITHHPRRLPDHPDLASLSVRWVTEEEFFRSAEILSIHLPGGRGTKMYVDKQRLQLLPQGALVINTGRGSVIDETALYQLLSSGRLGGAALDVRSQEPPPQPDPLAQLDNVILTPHVAGLTIDAQERVCRQVAYDVRRVLAGMKPLRPVPRPGSGT